MHHVRIDNLDIGDAAPAVVMAETASSHEGRPDVAIQLLRAAIGSGADLVKFQLLRGDDLLTPDHPKYGAFQVIQMPAAVWRDISDEGAKLGARLVAEVFDETSVSLAGELQFAALKIHSTDLGNPRMLDAVGGAGRPVFVSTGGSTFAEIEKALERLDRGGAPALVLLHGFQSFPTRLADSNLRQIGALRTRFHCPVGYADHMDADSPMAIALPLMALGAGARVIEKHLTLDRAAKGRDYYSALNPDEFAQLVTMVREADTALGRSDDALSPAEHDYRKLMKKTTVARRDLPSGHVIADDDLAFRRAPREGVAPLDAASLVGRRLVRSIAANTVVTFQDIQA